MLRKRMGGKRIKTLASSIPQGRDDGPRDGFLELAGFCPFDQSNPDDCPLFPLRKMPPKKRLRWLNALSEEDWGYLVAYHHVCLGVRVEMGLSELRAKAPAQRET
jgi:hypothetical protein